jgi:hypothetical protein
MGILVSIFDRRTGESWKSIQCEVADRGEYALFGSYTVRKSPCAFSQKLVTSGAMRPKRKMNSTAGALVSNQNVGFFDPGADIPIYPFTAISLGRAADRKGLSFKGYSESLPAIGSKIDVDPASQRKASRGDDSRLRLSASPWTKFWCWRRRWMSCRPLTCAVIYPGGAHC